MTLIQQDFSSKNRYERLVLKNNISFSTSGGTPNTSTVTIPHNLGYKPFIRLFYLLQGFTGYFRAFNGGSLTVGDWNVDSFVVDDTNIIVVVNYFNTGSHTGTIYYRVYAEQQS